MPWIKRNLYFVIILATGLGVTGYCGYLLYSAVAENAAASGQYASAKSSLDALEKKSPYPDNNNIQAAVADAARVQTFLAEFRKAFAPFPAPPKMDDRQFNGYLKKSISQYGLEATNAGVALPPNYAFSWSQQTEKLNYPSECIEPWLQEMEEVHAILRILCSAKINYLENIKRPAVSGEDAAGDDYMRLPVVSNQWGVVTPYMVSFRTFSAEIANFLADFAASSNCFIVKAIYVTPSMVPLPELPEPEPQMLAPVPQLGTRPAPGYIPYRNPFMRRGDPFAQGMNQGFNPYSQFRERPRPYLPIQPVAPIVTPAAPAAPVTVLTEKPLFVTAYIDVIKLKPPEVPAAAAPARPMTRPRRLQP